VRLLNSSALTNSTGSSFNPSASQQGYPVGKSKRKRRGGINRKKRGTFQHQPGPGRDNFIEANELLSPLDGPEGSVVPDPSPIDEVEVEASKGLFIPALPEYTTSLLTMPPKPEIEPSAVETEALHWVAPKLEEGPSHKLRALAPIITDTSPPGEEPSPRNINKNESSPVIPELPRVVVPPSEPTFESPLAQNGLLEVTKVDSPSRSPSALFFPVPTETTTPPLPLSEPSLERCSTPRLLPINGLPEATTSSPVSSAAPTPSLQTPSPPYVAPEVIVAPPTVQEPEDDLVPASPVSSALQAVGVPAIVRPDRDTFSAHMKEAESLTEALRMVVGTRQRLDVQSREERVNPVLMSNRAVTSRSPDVLTSSADTLVQEVLADQRVGDTIQAFRSHMRGTLVAKMTARQETVDEKVVRLRREYLALHKEWVARCAELDNSHRVDPAAGEVAAVPARTTRRSAAVLGDAVRSDLEMEQIIASLGNDELYDPAHLALRNLAVIPDMIAVTRGKVDAVFDDTNNTTTDPQSFFDPSPGLAEWTDDEVEIFKQRFAKYPKQFGHIATGLAHKTQAQCVQFYYLHKKAFIDFREAITTYGQSKRRRGGRKTDKKKGGLLADIRQHDAEVSKEQDPGKRRAGAAARRRRESARVAPRRSITAVQQDEQTPITTPTPEPEPELTRPKRRRNARPVPEPEPVVTEEPPSKRSRRASRRPKLVPDTSTPELKPLSKTAIEAPSTSTEDLGESVCKHVDSFADAYTSGLSMELHGKDFKPASPSTARDPPHKDKRDSPELIRDIAMSHERQFPISDVPPISATSRFHLMDSQSHTFSIPGPSPGSTLRLYS
jgi:hypothetical protein